MLVYIANCTGGCQNEGTCILPEVCTCAPGWTGTITVKLVRCNQTLQKPINVFCLCLDVNECNGDHECDHNCTNIEGTFECLCDPGYELQPDNRTCEGFMMINYCCILCNLEHACLVDINECSDSNGGCQHNCTNIVGAYYCSCVTGYSLDDDGHNCSCKLQHTFK